MNLCARSALAHTGVTIAQFGNRALEDFGMRWMAMAAATSVLALAACAERSAPPQGEPMTESMVEIRAAVGAAQAPHAGEDSQGPAQPTGAPTGAIMLAYAYQVGIETPAENLRPLMTAHERACIAAGAKLCQVLGSDVQSYGEDRLSAKLSLRAEPGWLANFRVGLEGDAREADGRIIQESTSTEDLTRAIVDGEAKLRALTTLRDRLQSLLAQRPGKLGELLELERELARVQGEIDAYQSTLAVMRARVAMSQLDLAYTARANPVTAGALAPLGEAVTGFLGVVAQSFAVIVTLFAALLPFALVVGPLGWFGWKAWRRRQLKRPPAS